MKSKIKYSYCFDENYHLVHIGDIVSKDSTKHHYTCLECGNEMHPRIGRIKTPHFAHNPGVSCHGESYLHKLAKRKIMDHFLNSNVMSLVRQHSVTCEDEYRCPFYTRHSCCGNNSMMHNLHQYYDCCQEEAHIQGFIADLLLTKTEQEKRGPVLIEICVTHACEPEKIGSGLKIIETKKIESEEDIDKILRDGFIEGENCVLHGFKDLPSKKFANRDIDRFILHSSWGATIQGVSCKYMNIRKDQCSKVELNIDFDKLSKYMPLYIEKRKKIAAGLIYLKSKGYDIRNCFLCKYYCYNKYSAETICTLFKKYGTHRNPEQTFATKCSYYRVSQDLMKEFDNDTLMQIVSEIRKD